MSDVSDDGNRRETMCRMLMGENLNDAALRMVLAMAVLSVVLGSLAWLIH